MSAWTLPRQIEPETLDHLAADDPRAVRSRRDLRRVNRVMGSLGLLSRAIDAALRGAAESGGGRALQMAEIGAGDGSLALRLAQQRAAAWPSVRLDLVDRQSLVSEQTRAGFARLGWTVRSETADVFDWLAAQGSGRHDLVFANLFLHHFEPALLARLLQGLAACSKAFVALEPRRGPLALAGSHLIGFLGCNEVTRRDAVLSVRAGFADHEISALWPSSGWETQEAAAGAFGHCFVARRSGAVR